MVDSIIEKHKTIYWPFYHQGTGGTLVGKHGVNLAYRFFLNPNPRGRIVIAPGRTESILKYAETIFEFYTAGYDVFALDHRGQGFSQRMLSDPQIGYVEHFDDYAEDLETFMKQIVFANSDEKVSIVAHSMGGAVACRYIVMMGCQRLKGAIFSAPMLKVNFGYPEFAVRALVSIKCAIGHGKQYAAGMGPMDVELYGDGLSTSKERLECLRIILREYEQIRLGGPCNHWVKESLRAMDSLRQPMAMDAVKIPVLLMEAGEDVVVVPRTRNMLSLLPTTKSYTVFDNARHDLFIERDEIRSQVMGQTLSFLDNVIQK